MTNSKPIFNTHDNVILIRYSEIALKSDKVRKRLIDKLMKNIKIQITNQHLEYQSLYKDRGRLYLKAEKKSMSKILEILKHVFGIYSVSPALETTLDYDSIMDSIEKYAKDVIKPNDSFGLRTRKVGKKSYSSSDLAVNGGARIMDSFEDLNLKVNLTDPDVWIYVEAREKASYIYSQKIGTYWQGNPIEYTRGALAIINGRLSEFVSLFRSLKRGMYILPIFFNNWSDEMMNAVKETFLKIKQYLPLRAFYYIEFDYKTCYEEIITKIDIKTTGISLPLLEQIVRMKIIEWFLQNQSIIFDIFESVNLLNQKSNVAVSMSKNRVEKEGKHNRREFVEYTAIIDGNLSLSTKSTDNISFQRIESSEYPIFRAAIALDNIELIENFLNIDKDLEKYISIFDDRNFENTQNPDEIIHIDIEMVEKIYRLSDEILKEMGLLETPNIKNIKYFKLEELKESE